MPCSDGASQATPEPKQPPQPSRHARRAWGRRGAVAAAMLLLALALVPRTVAARSRSTAQLARKLPVAKGEHTPYCVATPHFEVGFSVPRTVGRTYAVLCERAYGNFCRKFSVPTAQTVWEGRCHVYIFATREEFRAFAATVHQSHSMANAGGYARINKRDPAIVLFLHDGDHSRLKHVLIHEMTHVFLQLFHRSVKLNTWLHEGFAQFFEFSYEPRRSRLAASRTRIKRLVREGMHTRLNLFWEMTFPPDDLDSYAQAWSLVDFMVKKGSAKRAGKFVLALKDGRSQEEALREVFGCSLARFEAAWKRYVIQAY